VKIARGRLCTEDAEDYRQFEAASRRQVGEQA
jgi:hypothetical protein